MKVLICEVCGRRIMEDSFDGVKYEEYYTICDDCEDEERDKSLEDMQ